MFFDVLRCSSAPNDSDAGAPEADAKWLRVHRSMLPADA